MAWHHAHDEYAPSNKKESFDNNKKRTRTKSIPKRPKRPPRTKSNKKLNIDDNNNNNTNNNDNTNQRFKYRGKGGKKDLTQKPNPWSHAHDEYANRERSSSPPNAIQPTLVNTNNITNININIGPGSGSGNRKNSKTKKGSKGGKGSKAKRPVRNRNYLSDNINNNNDDLNDLEEKSNRPLKNPNRRTNRRPQKPIRKWVNADNIHGEQYRSAYRSANKPLPPPPLHHHITQIQKGKEQFRNVIKQAAQLEGLDKNDPKVQGLIQRLGDQMSDVTGFDNFLRHKDIELAKIVKKQAKRREQYDKYSKKLNNNDDNDNNNNNNNNNDLIPTHKRKQSVKDMAARYEKKTVKTVKTQRMYKHGRHKKKMRHDKPRNVLPVPNTQRHRRRVSSQISVGQLSAIINQNAGSNSPLHTPLIGDDPNKLFVDTQMQLHDDDNISIIDGDGSVVDININMLNSRLSSTAAGGGGKRISLSHHSINDNNSVIISDNRSDNGSVRSTQVGGGNSLDPLKITLQILQNEPFERSDNQIDFLVSFFEEYQIMTEDVDAWSGAATFRSFIQQTRYKHVSEGKYIFREGDDGDEFYFVLRGDVSVLVSNKSNIQTSTSHLKNTKNSREIHVVSQNHIFGEIAMFNQGKRSATCVAKTDTDLAYWDRATYDSFIRPMKELRHRAQKILRDKRGNMLSDDQLIEKAAMFLDDAMHGRELKMHRNGPWPRRIHKLINHKYFNYCLIIVSLLWLLLIIIEPPSYNDSFLDPINNKYYYRILPLLSFEWFVFIIFLLETLLRIYSFGVKWFWKIDLHIWRVVLLTIFWFDLIITSSYSGNSFRFSRIIRPFFPILFIRDLRRQYYIVLSCIPYIIELIILYCIISSIFARIAYHIFYHSQGEHEYNDSVFMYDRFKSGDYPYNESMGSYCRTAINDTSLTNCEDFFDYYVWESWSSFFKSFLSLFVLLTTENYPDVWWPSWLSNGGHSFWAFFLIYALISVFFMMNLFSAAIYDAYQHIISSLDVLDEKRETAALKVAWICLDTGETGNIGYQKFENLMYRLKPDYTEFQIGVLFRLLDPDGNRLIDAEEFSVMMINVLYLSISRKSKKGQTSDDELKLYLQKIGSSCPYGYEILRLFTSNGWRYFMLIIQSVDICSLLSYHMYPVECNILDIICIIFILIGLVLDIIFTSQGSLNTYFKSSKNRLYCGLTLIQSVGTFIGLFNDREWLSALRFFGILRMLVVGMFALEKIKFLRTSLTRTLTQTVIFMIPVFCRIVLHILIVLMYIYIIIGLELFVSPDPSEWGKSRCYPSAQVQSNPYALFCDANMALITLFQVITTNNWHIIMYEAVFITNNWLVSLYFVSFFFFGPILIVSLLLAMFFNMFFGVSMQSEHELSAFFQETDEDAKEAKNIINLREDINDNIKQSLLPVDTGISSLQNGIKILTISRNGELVHIPLINIAKEMWDNLNTEEYCEQDTQRVYQNIFDGSSATNYLINTGCADDVEDAVDYLSLIMEEYGVFRRIDNGKNNEFENNISAHYQWIISMDTYEEDLNDDDNQSTVALDDIMIGFRHSYGGYHRLLKEYRRAGVDPSANKYNQNMNYHQQQQSTTTDVTPVATAAAAAADDNPDNDTNINHVKQKSEKSLKLIEENDTNEHDNKDNNKQLHFIDEPINNDDDTEPVLNQIDSSSSAADIMSTKDIFDIKKKKNQNKIRNNNSSLELTLKRAKTKPSTLRKTQSTTHDNDNINRRQTMPHSNNIDKHLDDDDNDEEQDIIVPLPKSKSVKPSIALKNNALKRSVSSKNILLRHLDKRSKFDK